VLNIWEDEVFNDYLIDETTLKKVLKDIAIRTIELNEGE
jgi:hypothetical protein